MDWSKMAREVEALAFDEALQKAAQIGVPASDPMDYVVEQMNNESKGQLQEYLNNMARSPAPQVQLPDFYAQQQAADEAVRNIQRTFSMPQAPTS